MRSAKREMEAQYISPSLSSKGHHLSLRKAYRRNPALFWESRGTRESTAFAGFNAHRRSEPNAPKQSGAIFCLKYTFHFEGAKISRQIFFEPGSDSRYNCPPD
jgi:hypothetical protein